MRALLISLLQALMLAGLLIGPWAGVGHAATVPMHGCHGAACAEAQVAPCPDASGHAAAPCNLAGCLAQTLAIAAPDVAPAIADRVALTLVPPVEARAPKGHRADLPDRPPAV